MAKYRRIRIVLQEQTQGLRSGLDLTRRSKGEKDRESHSCGSFDGHCTSILQAARKPTGWADGIELARLEHAAPLMNLHSLDIVARKSGYQRGV